MEVLDAALPVLAATLRLAAPLLLAALADLASPGARIVAQGSDPYGTRDPVHVSYHERNRSRGRFGGQLRLRLRYRMLGAALLERLGRPAEDLDAMEVTAEGTDVLGSLDAAYRRCARTLSPVYQSARYDFGEAARQIERRRIVETVQPRMGAVASRAGDRLGSSPGSMLRAAAAATSTGAAAAVVPSFPNQRRTPTTPKGFA